MKDLIDKVNSITFDAQTEIESKALRSFLHVFTEMGSTIGAVIIITTLTFISGFEILYVLVPIYLFQLVMVELIKFVFKKPRPESHKHKNLFGIRVTSGSFPSGHTSNIFCLAFLITNFYQLNILWTLLVFVIAGSIAYSRIVLGRHYVIDVVAGAVCGLVFSIIGSLLIPQLLAVIL